MIIPFFLKRNVDISGNTGIGFVAEGVILPTKRTAITWLCETTSGSIDNDIESAKFIHSHGDATQFIFSEINIYPKINYLQHQEKTVAVVVEFSNNWCVTEWLQSPHQIKWWCSMKDFKTVQLSKLDYKLVEHSKN